MFWNFQNCIIISINFRLTFDAVLFQLNVVIRFAVSFRNWWRNCRKLFVFYSPLSSASIYSTKNVDLYQTAPKTTKCISIWANEQTNIFLRCKRDFLLAQSELYLSQAQCMHSYPSQENAENFNTKRKAQCA